jgi:hypothetical protein
LGGTAPRQVRLQIARHRARLAWVAIYPNKFATNLIVKKCSYKQQPSFWAWSYQQKFSDLINFQIY